MTRSIHAIIAVSAVLLSVFLSCGNKTVSVDTAVSGIPVSQLENLLSGHPLPEGFEVTDRSDMDSRYSIMLESRFTTLREIMDTYGNSCTLNDRVILGREWYAPVSNFLDFESDGADISAEKQEFVPLSSISLPDKALPVDGLFPGDPEYPGLRIIELKITARGKEEKKNTEILSAWIKSLPACIPEKECSAPVITWIGAAGDIMVQRGVEDILLSDESGIDTVFGDTITVMRKQDIMLGNLEGSITLSRIKIPKSYNFRFRPQVLQVLNKAGFDYLSITNNHIYDYGEKGFADSIRYMRNSPLATSGAGMNIAEASEYWETKTENSTVRVLSIGAYPRENNGFDGKTQASVTSKRPGILFEGPLADEAVRNMVSPGTFDIIFVHGGVEWTYTPTDQQKKLYRRYIDMGADLVLGSHPHVLQGIETRGTKLIAYSLGNFIFPGMDGMAHAEESLILSVGIFEGKIRYVMFYPVMISDKTIRLDRSRKSLERIVFLSKELN